MNTHVSLFVALGLLLLTHVNLVLVIDKVDNRGPRVAVIDIVTKPRRVDHSQLDLERLFLQFGFDNLDL
jgi:hypothetical protein